MREGQRVKVVHKEEGAKHNIIEGRVRVNRGG